MKRFLCSMLALASTASLAQNVQTNGGPTPGMPATVLVQRVAFGSGVPTPGPARGYEVAESVGNGLYMVPGYLPYSPTGERMDPRVVSVKCKLAGNDSASVWMCEGYSITPKIGRGEYILIQPVFTTK